MRLLLVISDAKDSLIKLNSFQIIVQYVMFLNSMNACLWLHALFLVQAI